MRRVLITTLLAWKFLTISFSSFSQELNLGLSTGLISVEKNIYLIGGSFEYRPNNAFFSLNTDPFISLDNKRLIFTESLYLKFILGNRFRICPTAGGFIRTSGNYGWLLGINLEYQINNKFILALKNEFYKDYYRDYQPSHFGGGYKYTYDSNSLLFSLGIKRIVVKK